MRFEPITTGPSEDAQRIMVVVDVVPGPLTEALAGRLLNLVTQELLNAGVDITAVAVEVHGLMASW